jgi:hypothetical protein
MKKIIIAILISALLVGVYFVFKVNEKEVSNNTAVYSSQELGFEFSYKTGPEGYVLEERTPSANPEGLKKAIVLMQTKDKENLDTNGAPVGGEGPATITINIFKNLKNRQPSVWVKENIAYSTVNLSRAEPVEVVVGGANGVRYSADGLYASDNVVVAHGGNIYVFNGMYIDVESSLKKDFSPIIDSVKFIPATTSQVGAKINIDEVCNGALAYMTFPDGASADKFVQDCKDGKYPEVIEKFKKEMGLGDGASI